MTLEFKVSGSPIPSVAWVHKSSGEVTMSLRRRVVELSGGTTSLTISELRYSDKGLYVCSAVNNLGSVSTTCKLTMLGKGCHNIQQNVHCANNNFSKLNCFFENVHNEEFKILDILSQGFFSWRGILDPRDIPEIYPLFLWGVSSSHSPIPPPTPPHLPSPVLIPLL